MMVAPLIAVALRTKTASGGDTTSLLVTPTVPVLSFIAHGNPIGQGNIRHLGAGRPAVHQNAKTLLPWRDTIRHAAIAAIGDREGDQPDDLRRCRSTRSPRRSRSSPSKRAGKSNAAVVMAEEMYDAGCRGSPSTRRATGGASAPPATARHPACPSSCSAGSTATSRSSRPPAATSPTSSPTSG
jgi:hypothetical protein